jgi:choline dehydrogenase-like flavoprotein
MPIYTGADIKQDRTLQCDVCIIGSGAGGAYAAAKLAKAGKKVIVLEDGGFHSSDKFDLTERNMSPRLYQEGGARATTDSSITIYQGRAVGGTTVINWTTCFRTPERVFDHWHEHHGVEGISHKALVPHWEAIEKELNVTKMTLEQTNKNNRVTYTGLKKLGWHADFLHRNVKNCAHTGYCGMGCPIDAKQSMLVTKIPEAVKAGADVYANAWVQSIKRDGRKCTAVVAKLKDPQFDRLNGVTITVQSKVTVLAGGAINTPAILLRSDIDANGRTGMRTFLHPAVAMVGIHADLIEPFVGSPQYVHSEQFVERGHDKIGMLIEGGPLFPMGTGGFSPSFGKEKQALMELLPHMSLTLVLLHDGFDVKNKDEGGQVSLKPNGQPRIDYAFSERLMEGLRAGSQIGARIQFAGGARQVISQHPLYVNSEQEIESTLGSAGYEPNQMPIGVAHVMGGCAMGTNERSSIVDSRSLRHHGFDNLFVIDGSVYPTSLTVNPQISIYGLASWASDFVLQAAG